MGPRNLTEIINLLAGLASAITVLLTAAALLFFFWGLTEMILNADNSDKLKTGRERMIWGLVALFIIFSLAGIIAILRGTFLI